MTLKHVLPLLLAGALLFAGMNREQSYDYADVTWQQDTRNKDVWRPFDTKGKPVSGAISQFDAGRVYAESRYKNGRIYRELTPGNGIPDAFDGILTSYDKEGCLASEERYTNVTLASETFYTKGRETPSQPED